DSIPDLLLGQRQRRDGGRNRGSEAAARRRRDDRRRAAAGGEQSHREPAGEIPRGAGALRHRREKLRRDFRSSRVAGRHSEIAHQQGAEPFEREVARLPVIINSNKIKEAIDPASRHNLYSGAVASHLNGCPDCHRYSDETASLLGLLGAQPRVEAPPDFEFRLRARIANAQATPVIDPRGFLRKIRPWTFSWGQTVAAAAALTLVVTV